MRCHGSSRINDRTDGIEDWQIQKGERNEETLVLMKSNHPVAEREQRKKKTRGMRRKGIERGPHSSKNETGMMGREEKRRR